MEAIGKLYSSNQPLDASIFDAFAEDAVFEDPMVHVVGRERVAVASELMPFLFLNGEALKRHVCRGEGPARYPLSDLLPQEAKRDPSRDTWVEVSSPSAVFVFQEQRYTPRALPRWPFTMHSLLVLELTTRTAAVDPSRIARFRELVLWTPPPLSSSSAAPRPLPFLPHAMRRLVGLSVCAFFAARRRWVRPP